MKIGSLFSSAGSFYHYSYPKYPYVSQDSPHLTGCADVTGTLWEAFRPVPLSRTLLVARPHRPCPGQGSQPGGPDGLVTDDSVDENALPAKETKSQPDDRPAWRAASFAAAYSW